MQSKRFVGDNVFGLNTEALILVEYCVHCEESVYADHLCFGHFMQSVADVEDDHSFDHEDDDLDYDPRPVFCTGCYDNNCLCSLMDEEYERQCFNRSLADWFARNHPTVNLTEV